MRTRCTWDTYVRQVRMRWKKTKHFDTMRRDRARLLTPTSLTVHRFAFVAFHSSVTARKSNTQNVFCDGIWFEQDRKERRQRATRKPHTYSACLGAYFPALWGPHKKCLPFFCKPQQKRIHKWKCVFTRQKKDCRAHKHNSSAVGQLLWWEKLRMQKEEKPCLLQWCCKRSVHSFMPYTHKYL